ncbi:MAG: gspF [Burkholderiaceae bacterium]|nr:gspF [Burkholderiaceae bacterium]
MSNIYIVLAIIFVAVFSIAFLVMYLFTPDRIEGRLQSVVEGVKEPGKGDAAWIAKIAKLTTPFAKLAIPKEGWDQSHLRLRFINAGYRGEYAPIIYFGMKTLLALIFPVLAWMLLMMIDVKMQPQSMMFPMIAAAALGYYLPNILLSRKIAARKLEIFENFPDALDLMTICIEAGLAIDAAVGRVAMEMSEVAPVLSEELYLVTLELRAGSSKERALRNLAMRTGAEEVDTLVAMLIQAERFGTSIADSLRVHADGLRVKRRQRAEEAAAKIPLKLLFPLIFCVFPALMVVLMGPAVIQISRSLFPAITGGQ